MESDGLDALLAEKLTPGELLLIEAEAVIIAATRKCPQHREVR